jgi:hypothetical protein
MAGVEEVRTADGAAPPAQRPRRSPVAFLL